MNRIIPALALIVIVAVTLDCSSSDRQSQPPVVVFVTADASAVEAGTTSAVTATIQNDPKNRGVTWALTGPGTLSGFTDTSVTYHAPDQPPASDTIVSIVAIAKADHSKQGIASITVLGLGVSLSSSASLVIAGDSATISAQVISDPSASGVTWSLSPASGAGTLSDETSTSVTFTAPPSPPSSDLSVVITATSVADGTRTAALTITVPQVKVSVSPVSGLMPRGARQSLAATVLYDPAKAGASWSLTQGGQPCSPACGTVAPLDGDSTTYTAPVTLPGDASVTVAATSRSDRNVSASATLTLTTGTLQIIPTELTFPRIKGSTARVLPVTLTNAGASTLAFTDATVIEPSPADIGSPFSQTNDCGTSIPAAASCTISVQFKPSRATTFSATLSISDNSADSPQRVSLHGSACTLFARVCKDPAVQAALAATRVASTPAPSGPSIVGTKVLDLVDRSREDPYLANGTKRELLVRLWYPATVSGSCQRAEYAPAAVWEYFAQLTGQRLPQVTTNSCRDARISSGAYPVVVFTHGFTGTFTDYTFVFEDLASRGYIVVSVDHTYEATAVAFPDGRLVKSVLGSHLSDIPRTDQQTLSRALAVRLEDLKFVMDELERLNRSREGPLSGHLDLSSVAVAGHSFGGLTALMAIEHDPRFRAAISLDGLVPGSDFTPTSTPVLLMDASRNLWTDAERGLWQRLRGPRLALNLRGSEHATPSDAVWLASGAVMTGTMTPGRTVAAIRDYVAAFLDAQLQGRPTSRLLMQPSAVYPDVEVTSSMQ
ncbi:MAG TPA: choice-of-anchor D domain-containing protein [Vicinamibacterales bacterium]|nr:choice-of-anchor D domain-containing protein [Vicinamibacterales bacterium]